MPSHSYSLKGGSSSSAADLFASAQRLVKSQLTQHTAEGRGDSVFEDVGGGLQRNTKNEKAAIELFKLAVDTAIDAVKELLNEPLSSGSVAAKSVGTLQTGTEIGAENEFLDNTNDEAYDDAQYEIDLLVAAGEHAMTLLWAQPQDMWANAELAISIGARVCAVVSSYRTLAFLGYAKLRVCLLLQDLSARSELEESVVSHMRESLYDLSCRYEHSGGSLDPAVVKSTFPIELRSCMALCVCARYEEGLKALEELVDRIVSVDLKSEMTKERTANAYTAAPAEGIFNRLRFDILDFATTRIVASHVLLANLCTTLASDAIERALVVVEFCVREHPSHPLGHLMLCHIYRRLGIPQEEITARLSQVFQVVISAITSLCDSLRLFNGRRSSKKSGDCSNTNDRVPCAHIPNDPEACRGRGTVDSSESTPYCDAWGILPQRSACRSALALVLFCAATAMQCDCDDLVLEAVRSGVTFIGLVGECCPLDNEALAQLLSLEADICLRKAMSLYQAADVSSSTTPSETFGATGTESSARQRQEAEELMVASERHVLRALQLFGEGAWAHLVNARRQRYLWERATISGSAGDEVGALLAAGSLLCYESAIRCNPRLAEAYEGAGHCHLQAGRFEEASEMLLTSVTLQSKHPLIPVDWFLSIID